MYLISSDITRRCYTATNRQRRKDRVVPLGLGGISSLYDILIYFYKQYGMKQFR